MNSSIVYESLEYLRSNFVVVASLSLYIFERMTKEQYTDSKLTRALQLKDSEIINTMIYFVQDKNILTKWYIKYIHEGIKDNLELIETLLYFGPKDLIHADRDLLFRVACEEENVDICRRILIWNPDISDLLRSNALLYALRRDNVSLTHLIEELSENIICQRIIDYVRTTIYSENEKIIIEGNEDKCLKLFETGYYRYLQIAIKCGHNDIITKFIDKTDNIDYRYLLMVACNYDNLILFKNLMSKFDNVTLNSINLFAEHVIENDSIEIFKYLWEFDIDQESKFVWFRIAAEYGSRKIIKFLLKNNIFDQEAIGIANFYEHYTIESLLISFQSEIN